MSDSDQIRGKEIVDELEERLQSITGKIRLYYFIHGIGVVLLTAFLFAAVSFLLDYLIPDLPAPVRVIISLIGIGIVGYQIWKSLLKPQLVNITPRDIALAVEDSYPQLKDRLISALDLVDQIEASGEENRISTPLVEQLLEDLKNVTQKLNLSGILSARTPLKRFGLGAFCLLLAGGFALQFPEAGNIWAQRMMGGDVQWPKSTKLTLQNASKLEVVAGKQVELRAKVPNDSREIPETATIYLSYESGKEKEANMDRMDQDDGSRIFSYRINSLQDNFSYQIAAGDNITRTATVRKLERPEIDVLYVRYDYPEYTGKKDTPEQDPLQKRTIEAPYDTIAKIEAHVSRPIEDAQAYLDTESEDGTKKLQTPDPTGKYESPSVIRTEVPVRKDGSLYFNMTVRDTDNQENFATGDNPYSVESVKFPVHSQVDTPPNVRVTYPNGNPKATPNAVFPIKTEVSDDFGIKYIRLNIKVKGREEKTINFTSAQNNKPYESKKIKSKYDLDFSKFNVEEGDEIKYTIQAKDMGEKNDPVSSREYKFDVVSDIELEKHLSKLQEKIRDELEKVKTEQERLNNELSLNRRAISPEKQLNSEMRRQLKQRLHSQRSTEQHMGRVVGDIRKLKRMAEYNSLWTRKQRQSLTKILGTGEYIHVDLMPRPEEQIAKALNTTNLDKRKQHLNGAQNNCRTILAELDKLLGMMEDWASLSDVIHEWKKIKGEEERLRELFRKLEEANDTD